MTLDGAENLESDRRARTARSEMARQFVGPDGCRVSYLTVRHPAAGPTILLIHGSGVSAGYWVNQLRGLGRALRVVAIDLPGHGASDPIEGASVEAYAETTAHFLELLGAAPVIVAGHSLGGAVAIALAARHPGAVTGLVLLSSCAKLPPVHNSWERWLAYLPGPLREILFFSIATKFPFPPSAGTERTCRPPDTAWRRPTCRRSPPSRVDVAARSLGVCSPGPALSGQGWPSGMRAGRPAGETGPRIAT